MKAFPLFDHWDDETRNGMNLRDYFAAKAMPAIVATARGGAEIGTDNGVITEDTYRVARCAYAVADAMMKAREQ